MLGTFGRFGVLSFNGNKMITTSGGGALICNDLEAKNEIMFYATQAREAYPYYQHEKIGYNYRMSNICAGIGRRQMTVAQEHIDHHKRLYELYGKLLRNVEAMRIGLDAAGIESRPLWKPMHCQPVYKGCPAYVNGVSESLFKVGLCLPSGPCVTEDEVRYIVEKMLGLRK